MKKNLLTLVALLATNMMFAQTENLLSNGDFEKWTSGQPDDWKSTTSASNATLSQSTDAHGGTYAVKIEGVTANKRMASKEYKLKAGTYTFSVLYKAETSEGATARIGYVYQDAEAKMVYNYSKNENGYNAPDTITNEWTKKTFEFTLEADTKVNLCVMNSKNYQKKAFLVDDAELTTEDGALLDDEGGGGNQPGDPTAGAITIKQAQAAAANTKCKIVGTVVALCKNGALFGDETGYIYYYKSGLNDLAIGDKLVVEGALSVYGGFKQFTNTATITKLSTETVTYPTPVEITPDSWATSPAIQYVKMTGTLNINGNYFNLTVEGNEAVGSIVAPLSSLTTDLTSGSTVTVYGFAIYTSGTGTTYVNIVATEIKIDTHVEIKDIRNTPETAYTVTQARQLITEGEGLDYKVYVKGTVKGAPTIDIGFGNATYWIEGDKPEGADKPDTLEVYRGLYLKEAAFINTDALKEGDEVIVYGQLVNYSGTYEFTQGNYLYSINGETDKPQEKPVITFTDITIAEAVAWVEGKTDKIVYDHDKTLKLNGAEVLFSNGTVTFVRENGKAAEFYNLGVTCEAGDVLGGEIRCSLENYYGIPEFIAHDSTDVNTVTITKTGNEPVPTETTIKNVTELKNLCDLVVLKSVTVTKETGDNGDSFYLKDGEGNQVQLRTNSPGTAAPEDYEGKTYDVVGLQGNNFKGVGQLFALTFTLSDDAGGGQSVSSIADEMKAGAIYDLQGRRVSQPTRGLYIVGSKKIVVK